MPVKTRGFSLKYKCSGWGLETTPVFLSRQSPQNAPPSIDNSDNKTDPNTVQKEVLLILPYLGLQSRILTKQVNNKQINSTAALTFELFSKARNV